MINAPYLLFIGDAQVPQDAKISVGIKQWRPENCVGKMSYDNCKINFDLPELTIEEAKAKGAKTFILGVANSGGYLDDKWIKDIVRAIEAGLDIAAGMHMKLKDIPEIKEAAEKNGVKLVDARYYDKPLKVGNGKKRTGKRILTVGTDCSIGKMFTTLALEKEMKEQNINCTFRATGQSGILISGEGIPIDAIVSDFIAGAVEELSPDNSDDHYDIIEGQGSLFHPAYAGVSLGLLHGAQPDYLILCHDPVRDHMRHLPDRDVPSVKDTIEINLNMVKVTNPNAKFIGISLNTSDVKSDEERAKIKKALREEFSLPVCDPVIDGVGSIIEQLGK